jgi:hypothetical protein
MNVRAAHICRYVAVIPDPCAFAHRGRTSGTTVTADRWFQSVCYPKPVSRRPVVRLLIEVGQRASVGSTDARKKFARCFGVVGPTRAKRLPIQSDRRGNCSARGHGPTRFNSVVPTHKKQSSAVRNCFSLSSGEAVGDSALRCLSRDGNGGPISLPGSLSSGLLSIRIACQLPRGGSAARMTQILTASRRFPS